MSRSWVYILMMTRYEEYNERKRKLYPRSPLSIDEFKSNKHDYLKIYFLLEDSKRELKEYKSKVIMLVIMMNAALDKLSPNSPDSSKLKIEILKTRGMITLIDENLEKNRKHSQDNSDNFLQWHDENQSKNDDEYIFEI